MIDIYKAIELFHQSIKGEKISDIVDVGHSFVMWSKMNGYDDYPETSATAINKTTGKVSAYFEPDHWDELDKAIEIKIPKDYH